MRHLEPEDIVSYIYRERSIRWGRAAEKHVSSCPLCAEAIAEFRANAESLAVALEITQVPVRQEERSAQIGQTILQAIAAQTRGAVLVSNGVPFLKTRASWQTRLLVFSTCCLLIAGLSFYAGRIWEEKQKTSRSTQAPQHEEAVVLVVLGNHLERSERLLVALNHPEDASAQSEELQKEARALLDENHACLQQAAPNDPVLLGVLQQLDTLLQSVTSPAATTTSLFRQYEDQEDTDTLLFEIRVLRERVPDSRMTAPNTMKGRTI